MFKFFEEKVEEIRRKPERARIGWAIGLTLVAMVFVFVIWVFSLKQMFGNNKIQAPEGSLQEQFNQIKGEMPDLGETFKDSGEMLKEGSEILKEGQAPIPDAGTTAPNNNPQI